MNLTIIYDNEVYLKNKGLKSAWGFSCLIETKGKKILFDLGWNGNTLISNLEKLGFHPKDLDTIVLSHQHWDHIGGLNHVLSLNSNVEVYVPKSFSSHLKNEVRKEANLFEISEPAKICEGVFTTGELGSTVIEQSLILSTPKGLLVITGCAHPGVESILQAASTKGSIYGLIGGLHGFKKPDALKNLNLIIASHCTKYKDEISRAFPDSSKKGGVGRSITID